MENYLISGGTIITLGDSSEVIENGAICIENGKIADFGPAAEIKNKYSFPVKVDATDKVVMPGFICAHHHFYSTLARGFAPSGTPACTFQEILEKLWWKVDRAIYAEDIYYSAMIPLIECIRNGTTTVIDHHASPSHRSGSLDIIAKAAVESGIRACLCYEVSDRNEVGAGIEENARFIEHITNEKPEHLAALLGIHASFTVCDDTLAQCREVGEKYGVGYHIHVAEGPEDGKHCCEKYGKKTVERLAEQGICGERSLFAHCIHVDQDEIKLLQDTKTMIVHNPESNMNNAVGVADIIELMEKGLTVGLGTDGMSSNMPAQMRAAFLLQRIHKLDPRLAFNEAPTMLLQNNAKIVNRYFPVKLGVIEKGAAADLAILDYIPPTDLHKDNFFGHFIYGMVDSVVDTTIAAGKILMQNKKILHLDEREIAAKSRELAREVHKRIYEL